MTRYRSDSRSLVLPIADLLTHAASGLGAGFRVLRGRRRRVQGLADLRVIEGGKPGSGARSEPVQTRPRLRVVGER